MMGQGVQVWEMSVWSLTSWLVHPQEALEQEASGPQLQVGFSTEHCGQGALDGHPA